MRGIKDNTWILDEIMDASQKGIPVSINGIAYSSFEIEKASRVLEDGEYMSDYIGDEHGNIVEIGFDRIKK